MNNEQDTTFTVSNQKPVIVEIIEVDEDSSESTSCFSKCRCCCSCCGNEEVRAARKDLSGIITDWCIDASLATYHILMRQNITAGLLTYAIVFNAGLIITFTNFCPGKNYKNEVTLMKSEIWKMSKFYGILMYIPSFFPICSAKLRLQFAKQLRKCELQGKQKNLVEIKELREKMEIFKEKALWDNCCEAFFESFPQAVLQIVLILMPTQNATTYNLIITGVWATISKYWPIFPVLIGLYGITGAPIQVLSVRHKNMSWNILDKLAAYGSNALRVLSSALFIVAILTFTNSAQASKFVNTLWIMLAAVIIFGLMAGLYIMKFEVDRCLQKPGDDDDCNVENNTESNQNFRTTFRKKCPDTVISILGLGITIFSFYLWLSSQIYPLGVLFYDTSIVIGLYVILMVLTCLGVAFGRQKLAMYHEVVADIPVSAYRRIKSWISNICKKLFCSYC